MKTIQDACKILKEGGVVGMPTETVYGLAGSIESEAGIKNIFATKERPFFDPLIVHVSSINQAKNYTTGWNDLCEKLATALWPGPVTFVVPKNEKISDLISSGLETVGLRMPKHKLALELIETLGNPIAAPSANKFKKTSPTSAKHVQDEFKDILVIDGGQCEIGIESTVLGVFENEIKIYRPGMINKALLQEIISDEKISIEYIESPVAPGHLKHHYMPEKPVIVHTEGSDISKVPEDLTSKPVIWTLPEDSTLAARELYSKFKEFDKELCTSIIIKVSTNQLASEEFKGILNRLEKAASFFI